MAETVHVSQELKEFSLQFMETTKEQEASRILADANKQRLETARATKITCELCLKSNPISDWVFVQKKHYIPPRGCMEGDYWSDCSTDVCDIKCPCGAKNYLYNHPQKQFVLYLESIFAKRNIFNSIEESSEQ